MKHSNETTALLQDGSYLTDGGMETTLMFEYGIDLPHFAAFPLVETAKGREALRKHFSSYMKIAAHYGLNYLLDVPTWRANSEWGYRLGYSNTELAEMNRRSVAMSRSFIESEWTGTGHILLNGQIGPRGDGYVPGKTMSTHEAQAYHVRQIRTLGDEAVDLVTGQTLNYTEEAIGIVNAAREAGVVAGISFTVETDGRLPSGEPLREAIERTDASTDAYALLFMVNCAHPTHFNHVLQSDGEWKDRLIGLRANASTKSHAELNESETLDQGDRQLLSEGFLELQDLMPAWQIFGGCCGTNYTHMEAVCKTLYPERVALSA